MVLSSTTVFSDASEDEEAAGAADVDANQRARIAERAEMRESLQCEGLRLLEASWPKKKTVSLWFCGPPPPLGAGRSRHGALLADPCSAAA